MKNLFRSFTFFAFLSLLPYLVLNAQPGPGDKQRRSGPCSADAQKLCKDVKPGQGRVFECLIQHEGELAPACKDHLTVAKERRKQFSVCKEDREKFCKGIEPGKGRIAVCMHQNLDKLSEACKNYLLN